MSDKSPFDEMIAITARNEQLDFFQYRPPELHEPPPESPEPGAKIIPFPTPTPPVPASVNLTAGQQDAVAMAKRVVAAQDGTFPHVGVIVGYAGSGKTFTLQHLAHATGIGPGAIVLTPTGRAAVRVKELTGLQGARTVQRWLHSPVVDEDGVLKGFSRRAPDKIEVPPARTLLMDESSMINPDVWKDIRDTASFLRLNIILTGDGFQLPPVKARKFSLLDGTHATDGNTVTLTEIVRQEEGSPIIAASMLVRERRIQAALKTLPSVPRDLALPAAARQIETGGMVVCCTNKTRRSVNTYVRAQRGLPPGLSPGEPFMVTENSYPLALFNGDRITFEGWEREPEPFQIHDRKTDGRATAHYGVGRFSTTEDDLGERRAIVILEEAMGLLEKDKDGVEWLPGGAVRAVMAWLPWKEHWARVVGLDPRTPLLHGGHGYCYTVHRSQGSQWERVLVLLERWPSMRTEEGARLFYTAITRASKHVAVCDLR